MRSWEVLSSQAQNILHVQVIKYGQAITAAREQEGGSLSHFETTTALAFRCGVGRIRKGARTKGGGVRAG